jgi:hypothetical protein
MRPRGGVLAGLMTMALAFALAPSPAMAGSISGSVSDASSHDPLAGIEVCAYPIATGGSICAETNLEGGYAIGSLASGQYRVGFRGQEQSYVTQYFDHEMRWADSDPVTVGSGAVTGIDAELELGGRIEGSVVERASGEPTGAWVCARSSSPEGLGECARADISGEYVIKGLPAAEYKVEFWPEDDNLLLQYYDHSGNWWFAKRMMLAAQGVLSGIDAELETGGRIEGTVRLAATGEPVVGVKVCASESAGIAGSMECAVTGVDGTYRIEHLPPTAYKVEFWPVGDLLIQFWNRKPGWNEADEVLVGWEQTVAGIDAYLEPQPPVSSLLFPPPLATPPPPPLTRKPLPKCRKGFHRKLVKGKRRCVRKHRPRRHGR